MKYASKMKIAGAVLALAAGFAGLFAADAEQIPYTEYYDWQFVPVKVKDPNAGENVRFYTDFTVPIHGPWLLNPAPDSITVGWITRVACAAGIEYREKGTEEFTQLWTIKCGQIDYSKDLHLYHINGLKPGTEYEYRLVTSSDNFFTAYHGGVNTGREIHTFKTMDPKKTDFKVFFTADIHGSARLCLDRMIEHTGSQNADFYFFLGDNVEDTYGTDARYYLTFCFLDDVCRVWGKNKPTVFVRGNHDTWGPQSIVHGDYFPQQDGKTYGAIRQGTVLMIYFDTIWPHKVKLQEAQHQKYREEQVAWLKALKKTDLWKTAKFRVAMGHVAPFASDNPTFMTVFEQELRDNTPEGKIHIFLAGHEHTYYRINPNTKEARVGTEHGGVNPKKYPPKYLSRYPIPDNEPYTLVVGHCQECLTMDATADKLVFKSFDISRGKDVLFDSFEILPDGSVKDLIPTTAYPIPQPQPKPEKTKK